MDDMLKIQKYKNTEKQTKNKITVDFIWDSPKSQLHRLISIGVPN